MDVELPRVNGLSGTEDRRPCDHRAVVGTQDRRRPHDLGSVKASAQRLAQGFLGCTLLRMGQPEQAATWLNRAGQGDWSACVAQPAQALPPPP